MGNERVPEYHFLVWCRDGPGLSPCAGGVVEMTAKQRKLIRAKVRNPNATLKELARKTTYAGPAEVWDALQGKDVQAGIRAMMNRSKKLQPSALLKNLEEGLAAKVVFQGSQMSAPDHNVRHKWWQDAMKLQGALKNDDSGSQGAFNISLILLGGGTEEQRDQYADMALLSRRNRGLHPLENRKLTPEEVAEYGKQ